MFPIWPTGNFQPVQRLKIKAWNSLYPVFTKGKVNPSDKSATAGQGNAPFRVIFVDTAGSSAGIGKNGPAATKPGPSNNADRPVVGRGQERGVQGQAAARGSSARRPTSTWTRWATTATSSRRRRARCLGRAPEPGLEGPRRRAERPGIAMEDPGNAAKALGLMKFKDIGQHDPGRDRRSVKLLTKYKKDGQFRAFWSTFNESVNLMGSKEVVIESMWSPAVALLVAQGVPAATPSRRRESAAGAAARGSRRTSRARSSTPSTTTSTGCTKDSSAR